MKAARVLYCFCFRFVRLRSPNVSTGRTDVLRTTASCTEPYGPGHQTWLRSPCVTGLPFSPRDPEEIERSPVRRAARRACRDHDRALEHGLIARRQIVTGSGGSIRRQRCLNLRFTYLAGDWYEDEIVCAFSCAALNSAPV